MRSLVSGAPWSAGSSIVEPAAGIWALAFLRSAFYRRPRGDRAVSDLRFAHSTVATYWSRLGRRISNADRRAFVDAFGANSLDHRLPRHCLSHEELRAGAARLIGPWFPEAWADDARRGYGIAFPDTEARRAYDPALRLASAKLGPMEGPRAPSDRQIWKTYPAVRLARPQTAMSFVEDPARWPDFGSAAGRFIPLRAGGLSGQTFEIHLMTIVRNTMLLPTRGYVTCTAVYSDPEEIRGYIRTFRQPIARRLDHADMVLAVELTTHRGHFMGRGISRILVYREQGSTYIRDVGSWDPLPPFLEVGYRAGGKAAQELFWGTDEPELGTFVQLSKYR